MRESRFSTVLWCLGRNIPLGHLKEWTLEKIEQEGEKYRSSGSIGFFSSKEIETAGRKIVNGLSQYHVSERLSQEWELLGSPLRMAVTRIANEHGHSGNVRKGVAYLDQLTGGKILRKMFIETERVLLERDGMTAAGERRVRSLAVIGAKQAFAAFATPKDYHNWSPSKKKAFREQMARERRASRS